MDRLRLFVTILYVLLLGIQADKSPSINPNPLNGQLVTVVGQTSSIQCKVGNRDANVSIQWIKGGSSKIIRTGTSLDFPSVRHEDAGDYTCLAMNRFGTSFINFVIIVYGLQEDYGFVGDRSVLRNTQTIWPFMNWYQTLYLKGDVENKTAIILMYFKQIIHIHQGLEYNNQTGDLVVLDTTLADEGNYTLVVSDFVNRQWSHNALLVYVKPSTIYMDELPPHVNESKPICVSCIVDRVKPANVTFTWKLASNILSSTSHFQTVTQNLDRTMRITSTLTKKYFRCEDQQRLRCDVRHGVDERFSSFVEKTIVVYYEYQTKVVTAALRAVKGGVLTMDCVVVDKGKPWSTTYLWYKDGAELSNLQNKVSGVSTSTLMITRLTTSDDGEYGCQLWNGAGRGRQIETYHLEVLYAPQVYLTGPGAVDDGEDTTLWCSVDAKPAIGPDGLCWFLEDRQINTPCGIVAYKYQRIMHRMDRGQYRCTVTNDIGTESASYYLDVRYRPLGRPVLEVEATVMKVGMKQRLTCNPATLVDWGNPTFTKFHWKRNRRDLMMTKQDFYDIFPNFVTDGGNYTCAVWNIINYSDYSIPVSVSVEGRLHRFRRHEDQAPIRIEEGHSYIIRTPRFDDTTFSIKYTVSGGRDVRMVLLKSGREVSSTDFAKSTESAQQSATRVTFTWQLAGRSLVTCDQVTYYNGEYSFQATGMVAGLSSTAAAVFSISVQYPPMWNGASRRVSSAMWVSKTLSCTVCGNPDPSDYAWSFGTTDKLLPGTLQYGAELHIANVTSQHYGTYHCTVWNRVDKKSEMGVFPVKLEERGNPHKPVQFTVVSCTSTTLLVSWTVAFNGDCNLNSVELEYRKMVESVDEVRNRDGWLLDPEMMLTDQIANQICLARISSLQPNTMYSLRLRARNSRPSVRSTHSYSDYAFTSGQTKALPSILFMETKITEKTLTVSWKFENQDTASSENSSSQSCRQRSMVFADDILLEIFYRKAEDPDLMWFPETESKLVPVSLHMAVIPGDFDVTQAYTVIVSMSEGPYRIRSALTDVSIRAPAIRRSQTGVIVLSVVVVVVVCVLIFVPFKIKCWS